MEKYIKKIYDDKRFGNSVNEEQWTKQKFNYLNYKLKCYFFLTKIEGRSTCKRNSFILIAVMSDDFADVKMDFLIIFGL